MTRRIKLYARICLFVMGFEVLAPLSSLALTGGPSQAEVQSFEPAGTNQMVDLFTGDFNYNIPLLDVGGYPINMSYHAGIGMDQESSWVGLGWNINPGALNRIKRGLPDDFSGDQIHREINIKDNWTAGGTVMYKPEIFGFNKEGGMLGLGVGLGVFYNSYRGWGTEPVVNPSVTFGNATQATFGFRYAMNSHEGLTLSPEISLSYKAKSASKERNNFSVGGTYNSRRGLQEVGLDYSRSKTRSDNPKKSNGAGGQIGGMSFSQATWMPAGSNSFSNASASLTAKAGSEIFGVTLNADVTGYFSNQWLKNKSSDKRAYGYLYEEQKPLGHDDVLLDFNREPEGLLAKGTMNLPLTNHTYDIYSASGQGVGGSFRAMRSDLPTLHDDYTKSMGGGGSFGGEFGAGLLLKAGINVGWNYNKTESGMWNDGNHLIKHASHIKLNSIPEEIDYEPAFFASIGELSMSDTTFFDLFDRENLMEPRLNVGGGTVLTHRYTKKDGTLFEHPNFGLYTNHREKRAIRNNYLSYLCGKDADIAALDKEILDYPVDSEPLGGSFSPVGLKRWDAEHPQHHLSEMTVTGTDGMRYVYGIPAYNNTDVSMTFNVTGRPTTPGEGQVTYLDVDATTDNDRGKDNYFEKIVTPAYAHSYLLTNILSSDYVDMTGNGVSDDDLGTAVKINYSKASSNYRWRVPYKDHQASHGEGLKTDPTDDKGSVLYGEKELWYMHSVESKNNIAIFKLSLRTDGHGVVGEKGGLSTDPGQSSYQLDNIILYSKQEYLADPGTAVAIKTVHFIYDYSLCDGIDNSSNSEGKLTLKSVFFTYGSSEKGRTTPYKFVYSATNPDYVLKGVDRWGNYSPYNASLPNYEYPYTTQDKTNADNYAQAWSLSTIHLPSGGTINIEYEADDYAFVQDKKAMQMIKIAGFGQSATSKIGVKTGNPYQGTTHHDIIYFDLQEALTGGDAKDEMIRKYLDGIDVFQYTVFAQLGKVDGEDEYVKGYAQIDWDRADKFGVVDNGNTGYFPVKYATAKSGRKKTMEVNPIALGIWNFTRMQAPYFIYQGKAPELDKGDDGSPKIIYEMIPFQGDLVRMFRGLYKTLEKNGCGKVVDLAKSWIRLNNPNGKKLGGGHRVKKISLSDNWDLMNTDDVNAASFAYGQEYSYTTEVPDGNGGYEEISSGVASYEPILGGDENPFVHPRYLTIEHLWVPDDEYLMDNPIGESHFPSPSVGYSKVEVKALSHVNVERTATGKSVSEFYTAKDFPVIVKQTDMNPNIQAPKWKILNGWKTRTYFAGTQGYTIELNDMHGRPKASWNYEEGSDEPYSGAEYVYNTDETGVRPILNSYVKSVTPDGTIKSRMLGVEMDFHNDFRQNKNESLGGGVSFNTDGIPILVILANIISLFPGIVKKKNENYSAVTTKIINRKGILKQVIAHQEGATISTTNEIYDAITGEVLVTSVQNEFEDNLYSSAVPAYWAYDKGMGHRYKNNGLYVRKVDFTKGKPTLPYGLNADDYFVEGDEVLVYPYLTDKYGNTLYLRDGYATPKYHAWMYRGDDGILNLIDREGRPIMLTDKADIKVIRSGRKNMPGAGIMSVQSTSLPESITHKLEFDDVLNVSAVEYKDDWKSHMNYFQFEKCEDVTTDYYADIVTLLQTMDDDQTRFERGCSYAYQRHDPNHVEYYDITMSKAEIAQLNYFDPCVVTNLGIAPSLSFEFKKVIQLGVDKWEVTCTPKYDLLYTKDAQGNYIKLSESLNFGSYTGSTGNAFLNDIFYVYDDLTSTYLPITFKEIIDDGCTVQCLFPSDNLGDLSSSLLTSIATNSSVIGQTNTAWILKYNNESNTFDIQFDWQDVNGPEESCKLSIDLETHDIYNIQEFLSFDVTSGSQMRAETVVQLRDGTIDTLWLTITSDCGFFLDCEIVCGNEFIQAPINPYRTGLNGNWRPYKSWAYLTEREKTTAGAVRTQYDGKLTSFTPFYTYDAVDDRYEADYSDTKWVWSSEVTEYSQFGQELENKNPLNQYSSAMYGFNHTLPTAVASNSQYKQMYFDGFEQYGFNGLSPLVVDCPAVKLNIEDEVNSKADLAFDDTEQHTGNYSVKLDAGAEMNCVIPLKEVESSTSIGDEDYMRITKQTDDIGVFTPEPGKYVIGAWVKEQRDAFDTTYNEVTIRVDIKDDNNVVRTETFTASGMLIERWQRIEGVIELLSTDKELSITITGATDTDGWVDDLRIHPFKSNMISYVYNYRSLRVMAELDENNYATFYEYDLEGALLRVKKETIKGIATLHETRSHSKANN